MLATFLKKYLGPNYKTNCLAILSFLYTIPQVVTAAQQFAAGKPIDWHGAAAGLLAALIACASKDASNSSTSADVAAADAKAGIAPSATVVNLTQHSLPTQAQILPLVEAILRRYGVNPDIVKEIDGALAQKPAPPKP